MCRWLFYYGKETCVANLIYGANHALARQSEGAGYTPGCEHDSERNHEVNVHGCGIGWYESDEQGLVDELNLCAYSRPAVYTTVAAPSHDRNLRRLSKSIESSLLFGHVRAAGPGAAVHEYNCHPFAMGRYLFMHNGGIANYQRLRRGLLAKLRDDLFDLVSGTTDSELLFALILNELPNIHTLQEPSVLEDAVRKAIELIVEVTGGKPNSLNMAFTDGETIIATRFRNGEGECPPSLYFHAGPMPGEDAWDLTNVGGFQGKLNLNEREGSKSATGNPRNKKCFSNCAANKANQRQAILVASEPLSGVSGSTSPCPSSWKAFPAQSMLTASVLQDTSDPDRRTLRKDLLYCQKECDDAVGLNLSLQSLSRLAGQPSPDTSPTASQCASPYETPYASPVTSPRSFRRGNSGSTSSPRSRFPSDIDANAKNAPIEFVCLEG